MQLPLQIDYKARQSLQLQIFEQIRYMILDGRLVSGARMPASRVLAADLHVSRNTVVLAYDRLAAEGYIEIRRPTGAFISNELISDNPLRPADERAAGPAGEGRRDTLLVFRGNAHAVGRPQDKSIAFDFCVGGSDARLFPMRTWKRLLYRQLGRNGFGLSGYGDPAGSWELRKALAEHVGVARGIKARAEQVLVTSGIQQGVDILSRLFVQRGTPIAVENPCYRGAANAFLSYGARLIAVEVDGFGANVNELSLDPAFLYLTPSHQYPTGVTMALERREQVLAWAARADAYVIEDDYDSDFYYDQSPLPALHSLDRNGQVIYLGTFSKSLAAGLRVGYMILPTCLVDSATAVKALLDNGSAWLPQTLLAEFLTSGDFDHHLRRIRTIYRARRDCLINTLNEYFGNIDLRGVQSGMHVVWWLPEEMPNAVEFEQRCSYHGVGVYSMCSGNAFVTDSASGTYDRVVMLGYAALNEQEIVEGVMCLAAAAELCASGGAALHPRVLASGYPAKKGALVEVRASRVAARSKLAL